MPLSLLASTFVNNLLPILSLGGAGFVLGKTLALDSRTIGRAVFYIFAPALVFNLLLKNDIAVGEALAVAAFAVAMILIMGALALALGRSMALERPALIAVLIATMFGNTGNYGLPLAAFAFGEQGLRYGGLYFVVTSILFHTAGVLIASLGHANFKDAALGMFKVPTVYGVALALLANGLDLEMPAALSRTIDLAAGGSIPLMIVLLGVELSRAQWSRENLKGAGLSVSLRLLAAPAIALFLTSLFGIQGAAWQASMTQASMPAAVNNMILASEYKLDSSLVTAIVFFGTLLSPLTLTPLLVLVGR